MSTLHGNLPTFNADQILSASAHLNPLQRFVAMCYSDIVGGSAPVYGMAGVTSATYAMRHQWNTLYHNLTIHAGTVTVTYDGVTVGTIASSPGTINLTGASLTVDQIYIIGLTGNFTVNRLYEQQTTSYPTLASFANDTTPTAAQWQALANYADLISDALDVPQPVASQFEWDFETYDSRAIGHWLIHRGRNLRFKFEVTSPYNCGATPFTRVQLLAGALSLFDQSYTTYQRTVDETIDLVDAGLPTSLGQVYTLTVYVTQRTTCEYPGMFNLRALYEYSSALDAVAGWTNFLEWAHTDWGWGSSNPWGHALKIQTIKANMQLIAGAIAEVAIPSPESLGPLLFGIRRRRYLFYKASDNCIINWSYRGNDQQVTLPASPATFSLIDMDSLEGLLPGTHYWIANTQYALEDSHA